MEYEVNKGVAKTELNVKWTADTAFDEFRYRMLKENTIEGILSCVRSKLNDMTVYTYDITGMQSLTMRFEEKKFTLAEIKKLYSTVITTILKSEEYFLDKNCFLLTEELVQYEEIKGTYELLYCPETGTDIKTQLSNLTEYVLNHTDYSDKAAVAVIYEVFKMMRDEHTTLLELLNYIKEGRRQSKVSVSVERQQIPVASPNNNNQPSFIPPNMPQAPVMEKARAAVENPFSEKKEETKTDNENGISTKKVLLCVGTVAAGLGIFLALYVSGLLFVPHTSRLDLSKLGGAVLVIGAIALYVCYKIFGIEEKPKEKQTAFVQPKVQPISQDKLQPKIPAVQPVVVEVNQQPPFKEQEQRKPVYRLTEEKEKNAQQFLLHKFPYLLGKSHEQVDGVIYSDVVSKVHAEFMEEQGALYLLDMSSTNGTFVNSKRIMSNQKVAVRSGDHIQIADREYVLSC